MLGGRARARRWRAGRVVGGEAGGGGGWGVAIFTLLGEPEGGTGDTAPTPPLWLSPGPRPFGRCLKTFPSS